MLHQLFQSTLPRGERRNCFCFYTLCCNFNPRSHGGSDRFLTAVLSFLGYFNPRSHGGSDWKKLSCCRICKIFQSTLPRGERLIQLDFFLLLQRISIHAPTGGATDCLSVFSDLFFSISIHAPTGGATAKVTKFK